MPSLRSVLTLAAATLPAVASAAGTLGFALGIRIDTDQKCKNSAQFESDLKKIKSETGSSVVRIYTTSQCDVLENLLPALEKADAKAIIGLWPTPPDHFNAEIKAVKDNLPKFKDQVLGITVGSEHLYREEVTGSELARMIERVQKEVKGLGLDIPVGFADSWNLVADGSANPAIEKSEIILANAFSYWQGQKMNNATASFFDDILRALGHIQDIKGTLDFPFWVGETNWPTGGKNYKDAVPSTENAERYWKEAVCSMLAWGVNTFVFEAFDEPWKPEEKGNDVERHWGVMDKDGNPKWELKC